MGLLDGGGDSQFQMTGPPGQPQPGMDWKKKAAIGVGGGLLTALLGSKLSGGNVSFGEALGHLGRGFADNAQEQMHQKREWEHQQHGQQLKMIHDFFMSDELEGIDVSKYPEIQELRTKYSEALLNSEKGPDGNPLSPKEATRLIGMLATAKGAIGLAKREKQQGDIASNAKAQQEGVIQNRMSLVPRQDPNLMGPPPEGVATNDAQARGDVLGGMRDEQMAAMPTDVPQEFQGMLGKKARRADILKAQNDALDRKSAMDRITAGERMAREREFGLQDRANSANERIQKVALLRDVLGALQSYNTPEGMLPGLQKQAQDLMKELGVGQSRAGGATGHEMTPPPRRDTQSELFTILPQ